MTFSKPSDTFIIVMSDSSMAHVKGVPPASPPAPSRLGFAPLCKSVSTLEAFPALIASYISLLRIHSRKFCRWANTNAMMPAMQRVNKQSSATIFLRFIPPPLVPGNASNPVLSFAAGSPTPPFLLHAFALRMAIHPLRAFLASPWRTEARESIQWTESQRIITG